jgi:hypothetical protein
MVPGFLNNNILKKSGILPSFSLLAVAGALTAPVSAATSPSVSTVVAPSTLVAGKLLLAPKMLEAITKNRPPTPIGKPNETAEAGEVFVCQPYCEKAAKVFYTDEAAVPGGVGVQLIGKHDLKDVPSKSFRWILAHTKNAEALHPPGEKEAPPAAVETPPIAASPDAPSKYAETPRDPDRPRPSSPETHRRKESSGDDPSSEEHLEEGGFAFHSLVSGECGMGQRSLSTVANTQAETASNVRPIYRLALDLEILDLTRIKYGTFNAGLEVSYLGALGEKSVVAPAERLLGSSEFEFRLLPSLSSELAPRKVALILGYRISQIATNPDTARGFTSTTNFVLAGVHAELSKFKFNVIRSVIGQVSDADTYRGTSVSSGLWEFSGGYCMATRAGKPSFGRFNLTFCPQATLNFVNESGSGDPLRTVLTTSPVHQYTNWRIGIEVSLSRLWAINP